MKKHANSLSAMTMVRASFLGSIPKASINDLVPFNDDNVKILKLDKIKSAKLKNALKVAKDYL